jgi:hypothetical protein
MSENNQENSNGQQQSNLSSQQQGQPAQNPPAQPQSQPAQNPSAQQQGQPAQNPPARSQGQAAQNSYAQSQGQPAPLTQASGKKISGLAIAGLVVGIVAIIGSWIPLLNVASFVFAIIALGLSIPGLIITIKGTKGGKGVAIAGLVLGVVTIIIFFAMYGAAANIASDATEDALNSITETQTEEPATEEPAKEEPEAVEPTQDTATTVEWKQFIKEYEEWVDDYVAIVKKYMANPTDISLLADYTEMMEDVSKWEADSAKVEKELANDPTASAEYSKEIARITLKMASVLTE